MNRILLSLTLIIIPCISIYAQEKKQVEATRTSEKITINGKLQETAWDETPQATNFTQYSPYNGKAPSEATHVRFLYDDNALYVGAFLEDSHPDQISKNLGKRDNFTLADYFGVYIDPYNDASKAYGFFVTSTGVQVDVKSTTYKDYRWDAVWESAVTHTPNGWSIEMRIPYSALRFSKAKNQE